MKTSKNLGCGTYLEGSPPQRLIVSGLKYFIASFSDEADLDLLSVVRRWVNGLALGFLKHPLLLNMSASEKAATPVDGGFDFCRCGNTSSTVKTA